MLLKFATFEERTNKFFNAMLTDLNPKIYALSTDRFVFLDKQLLLTGNTGVPNVHVQVYINGVLNAETDALGDGSFSLYVTPVRDENNIVVRFA